jgi:hypothetical protein
MRYMTGLVGETAKRGVGRGLVDVLVGAGVAVAEAGTAFSEDEDADDTSICEPLLLLSAADNKDLDSEEDADEVLLGVDSSAETETALLCAAAEESSKVTDSSSPSDEESYSNSDVGTSSTVDSFDDGNGLVSLIAGCGGAAEAVAVLAAAAASRHLLFQTSRWRPSFRDFSRYFSLRFTAS